MVWVMDYMIGCTGLVKLQFNNWGVCVRASVSVVLLFLSGSGMLNAAEVRLWRSLFTFRSGAYSKLYDAPLKMRTEI
jgi:hypothetical protein